MNIHNETILSDFRVCNLHIQWRNTARITLNITYLEEIHPKQSYCAPNTIAVICYVTYDNY